MNNLIAATVLLTFAIAGVSPASVQSKPLSNQTGTVGVAGSRDASAERRSYLQRAQDEMRIWEQKLHDFEANVQVKATDAQARASKHLQDAWTETKNASSRLETAGEADWNKAKASFKSASAKLAVAWHKVNPAVN
jgi:membrane-bound lytic murein transglycosylase B